MLIYGQRDPRWAAHALGWGPADGTIGAYGCFDTVLAMIAEDSGLGVTPASIDEAFTAKRVFVCDPTGTFDLLPDNALDQLYPGRFHTTTVAGFQAAAIAKAVASPDTYAYGWISTPAVPTHFVLFWTPDAFEIADPWTGKVGYLAGYGGAGAIHKTGLVQRLPVASPPAAPPPPPPPGPGVPVPTAPPYALFYSRPLDPADGLPWNEVAPLADVISAADTWSATHDSAGIEVTDAGGGIVYRLAPGIVPAIRA